MGALRSVASRDRLHPAPPVLDATHLRALSDLAGPERAFLTVYLDAADDRSVLNERFARVRSLLADQPEETEHFEQSLALAQTLLDAHPAPAGGAVVAFAGWAADLAKAYTLPEPVGTRVWMGDAPYVRPAYELLEEHETFAVAVVNNTSARIFFVAPDEVDAEGSVRGDVKNRVKKGGWSQKRYARRREKQIEQYASELAADLQALDRERPFARLVLLGSDEPVRAVQSTLPTALAEKLVGTRSVDANASEAQLLDEAAEVAEAGERQSEEDLWTAIREQGMGPGLAAFGATSVLEALQQARVEAVLVDREAEIDGVKCRDCEHVAHGTPNTCGACGSRDVFRVDLVEAMTEEAVRTGAEVDFVDPFDALADTGGVAALLRYALEKGGAEQEERERRARAEQEQRERDERVRREREQREAEAPAAGTPVPDEAPPVTPPVAEPAPPAAEPVAEPTPEPVAEPAPPAVKPQPESAKRRALDRPPSTPPAVVETPAAARGSTWKILGWVLLALLLAAVLFVVVGRG